VLDRRPPQTFQLERIAGYGIIAPQRNYSAHLHRPWRAISESLSPPTSARSLLNPSSCRIECTATAIPASFQPWLALW
jgi:hypothetical protein